MDTAIKAGLQKLRKGLCDQIACIDTLLGQKSASSSRGKAKSACPASAGHLIIRRMFGHRDTTIPDQKEKTSYNKLAKRLGKEVFYEQAATMERFYSFKARRAHGETNWWSNDAVTLMNNWDAKHGTALDFLKGKPSTAQSDDERPAPTEPNHWREWAMHNWDMVTIIKVEEKEYTFSNISWEDLGKYDDKSHLGIRLEIHRNCK